MLLREEADVVIPKSEEGYEPLHAVYRRETCLPAIEAAIDADQWKVVAWFPQVKAKVDPVHVGSKSTGRTWQLREDAIVIYPDRDSEVTHPRTGQRMTPKIMGVPAPTIPQGADRRGVLAEQLIAANNPFFARATVNRIWYQLLGRGIVDPPDDFRDSNPPANDELLEALRRGYDGVPGTLAEQLHPDATVVRLPRQSRVSPTP